MNPLLLLLLLPNKQAQTQISWFYYLFNDHKRRQSKYREMFILFHVRPFCNCLIVAHIVIPFFLSSFLFFFFFFNLKKIFCKLLKRAYCTEIEFEITFRRAYGLVDIKTSRLRFYLNSVVLLSKFGTRGHRRFRYVGE